jgi:hypothetical protein
MTEISYVSTIIDFLILLKMFVIHFGPPKLNVYKTYKSFSYQKGRVVSSITGIL